MPRRRELSNLAAGIATKFISRNNDLNGYWALGILYKRLDEKFSTDLFSIDLKSKICTPDLKELRKVTSVFEDYFSKSLAKRNFDRSLVQRVVVKVHFDCPLEKKHLKSIETTRRGNPFKCSVEILDDLGHLYTFDAFGFCSKHNPFRELRSVRAVGFFERFRKSGL